ncbi:BREX-1 system adenine-specific DNA-methyltransferase PglX [Stutzerimonas stutzeri]|uniref:BREX-1 system adenine-specific DNA-methyltransferase PglX n=1 Tax=Stutzerimonas stutzeri TaxID=316 RepID=UPI0021F9F7FC|nr:BREX-1 system adenine-specific DNA-methyltransferase PglX [Stutzerimonas stutzeri]UVO16608.1 hypothetical protein KN217_11900 [Stutzerimonas stutzeri]
MTSQQSLIKFGFKFGKNGAHAARTMMLAELQDLFAYTPVDADRDQYREQIVDFNRLDKPTSNARVLTYGHLLDLYAMSPEVPLFRVFRTLWEQDSAARPVLAPQHRNQLLEQVGAKSLDAWLRDKFFEQHCKLFHHRPFVWHVWDGLKDGFSSLVNYHKFTRANLEQLIYTYLGDWIRTQQHGVEQKLDGADIRLSAAQNLKARLEAILAGEAPYDIFVRWKPLAEQPIGWEPDLNDGVRLNIRPFMTAEVLRHNKKPKLNIEWKKDSGNDVPSAPWYRLGLQYGEKEGARINDHHLSLTEKKAARG